MTFEETFNAVSASGIIAVRQFDDGQWHCNISMAGLAPGLVAEVKSDFNHDTALEAMQVCLERINAARTAQVNNQKLIGN